ncbi:uncharacterized protein LOC115690572 isoform X2 [Syzygium oleosum]|uniref:uncharacterized protein LOC115690572 isoform X2 n=1 Tax=Syzygium oleosum TaxID=219896 RepID=UPI0011D246BB|nr:uncharacterized protein LOC115690572 isoform X2 [Syzygium oleosum]XP_056170235.1 uncharacterized protein LOC115690572 isoform X2 [Syzygium oleosum]
MEKQEMVGEQIVTSWKYIWKITNFNSLSSAKYYSQVFMVRGHDWRLLIYPKGNSTNSLALYLSVADPARLPNGWYRFARFKLTLVNQMNSGSSKKKETEHIFTARESDWGFTSFIPLRELRCWRNGYLVDNTLIVIAQIFVPLPPAGVPASTRPAEPDPPRADTLPPVFTPTDTNTPTAMVMPTDTSTRPPVLTVTDTFDSYFTSLEKLINNAEDCPANVMQSPSHQRSDLLTSEAPSLEEVENAKRSLKECLSDIFKLNMKDRLAEAVFTLSLAQCGLSADQQKSIKAFWANFDELTSDFLIFEQDNAEFELQKLIKDQMFSTMKKNHETHVSFKQLLSDLAKEEEELEAKMEGEEEFKAKLEEMQGKREKLISEWEILMVESEEAKSGYKAQKKKVEEAEEKKRIAEERMSRSTTAWSNLKALFC